MAVFDQKMVAFDARLDAMKAGSKEPERTFSPGNKYARQPKSPPQGRLGNCYGCGQPGHFKRICPKLRACIEPQTVNTNKEPPEQKTVQSPGPGVARKSKASQSQRVTDIKGGYLIHGKIQGIDNGSDLTLIYIETFNSIPESARPWLQETQVRFPLCPLGGGLILPPDWEPRMGSMFCGSSARSHQSYTIEWFSVEAQDCT